MRGRGVGVRGNVVRGVDGSEGDVGNDERSPGGVDGQLMAPHWSAPSTLHYKWQG